MKIIHLLIAVLCITIFGSSVFAWNIDTPEIRGDDEYIGNFDGFSWEGYERKTIHIKLSQTGYRVSLPLANNVEYLYKPNDFSPYPPGKLIFHATIKAIVVNEKVMQIIVLEVPS